MYAVTDEDEKVQGRRWVAELVVAAMGWAGLSGPQISSTGRVSRATVDRVKRCEEVSDSMLRALGSVLGLPRDYLLYVRDADRARIRTAGASDPDLVQWTLLLMDGDGEDPAPSKRTRKPSDAGPR